MKTINEQSRYARHFRVLLPVFLLVSCSQQSVFLPRAILGVATVPAATYFAWADSASAGELQPELDRLQAELEKELVLVPLVQRAIVLYHLENDSVALRDLTLDGLDCAGRSRCEDYIAIVVLLKELGELHQSQQTEKELAASLQKRVDELEQQIDALTTIEQQLLERERRPDQ